MPSPIPFGNPMKSQFLIDLNYRNLNHGSFGTYPLPLLQAQQTLQRSLEAAPDNFIRYTQPRLIDESRAVLANLLNVPVSDCVLVRNATTGVNTVLHNLAITRELTSNDVVIYFETVYGAVERTLLALRESWGVQIRKVKYVFPLEEGELIARFKSVVEGVKKQGLTPKVAVFETIISNPGIRFPFEEVTALCREMGILSCIDGAHGVGMINLNLGELGCDFFTSNCHKWLYTPRSCAVLCIPERNQRFIRTSLPTSWGYIPPSPPPLPRSSTATSSSSENSMGEEDEELLPSVLPDNAKSPFVTLFEFTGTTDDSAYSCVPAAMKFRKEVCGGEEKIYSYLEESAGEAGDVVATALGTDVLRAVRGEKSGLGCAMVNVRLPIRVSDENEKKQDGIVTVRSADASPLAHHLHEKLIEKGTFVPCFQHGEWFYTRLSAQIYLEKSDFVWLGGVLKEILGGVEGYLGTLKVPRANL